MKNALTTRTTDLTNHREAEDRQLSLIRAGYHALEQARAVPDVKRIADTAKAAELLAQRQQLSKKVVETAYALYIDAMTRLGALLPKTPKAKGGR